MMLMAFVVLQMGARAQKDLHINALFEGKIVPQERMVETRVRGRSLSKYGLTYFRSLRFEPTGKQEKQIKALLEQDLAERTEQDYQVITDDGLYQVFLELSPHGNIKRMLCYKARCEGVLVIYMEGPQASIKTLESMSNK